MNSFAEETVTEIFHDCLRVSESHVTVQIINPVTWRGRGVGGNT